MDSWVEKAMQRWPNVPALFGWLGLDRRGRWLIKGEPITHPRIVTTINRNYGVDEHGRWYFQNGPQRGYINLSYAPFLLRRAGDESLVTHNELPIERPLRAYLDEEGTIGVLTEHGFGDIQGADLEWVLSRMTLADAPVDDEGLEALLALSSGATTEAKLRLGSLQLPVERLDAARMPEVLGFVRTPEALPGERVGAGAPD